MEENNLCPICNRKGVKVKNITVKHLVKEEFAEEITAASYFMCMNEECNIVYFSSEFNIAYNKQQLKVPIWFKNDAKPKYICYCSQVTEEQIFNAVLKDGAKDIKDIIRFTGAMKNANCKINNPLGKCCSPIIQETINKALKLL